MSTILTTLLPFIRFAIYMLYNLVTTSVPSGYVRLPKLYTTVNGQPAPYLYISYPESTMGILYATPRSEAVFIKMENLRYTLLDIYIRESTKSPFNKDVVALERFANKHLNFNIRAAKYAFTVTRVQLIANFTPEVRSFVSELLLDYSAVDTLGYYKSVLERELRGSGSPYAVDILQQISRLYTNVLWMPYKKSEPKL